MSLVVYLVGMGPPYHSMHIVSLYACVLNHCTACAIRSCVLVYVVRPVQYQFVSSYPVWCPGVCGEASPVPVCIILLSVVSWCMW